MGPEGSAYAIANWLVLSYAVFFLVALGIFLIALKRGMFRNIEKAKYFMLDIDEPDYYTPDWAREGKDDPDREHD